MDTKALFSFRHSLKPPVRERPIAIYGAGGMGRRLAESLIRRGFEVSCFIDRQASPGLSVLGLPVYRPEPDARWKSSQIVCGVFNRDVSPLAIQRYASKLEPFAYFGLSELMIADPGLLPAQYWLDPKFDYESVALELVEMTKIFADETSRELWERILAFRFSGDTSIHPEGIGIDSQYFGVKLPGWLDGTEFSLVDAGAYDGDSLRIASGFDIPIMRAYCFEPDPKNFALLSDYCRTRVDLESFLYPCATWNSTQILSLNVGMGEGSSLASDAGQPIQAVSLDQCLQHVSIDILKLDVEGAEMETLAGAYGLITSCRPYLALSIYHRPSDLWSIPRMIQSLPNKYSFYLRQHGHCGMDTILYGVPSTPRGAAG